METIMNGMCRCCASEGVYKDVKGTYTWMGEEEVYADMLRECFDISLSTSEHGEDGGICEVCITQLRNASNFKKQVQHTEEQFKKHVENKLFKPSIVKVEMTGDEDNDSDDNNLSAEEGFSAPEYEVPIKTESEEQKPKKRASTSKATTSRAKKAKNDNGESSTTRVGCNTDIKIEPEVSKLLTLLKQPTSDTKKDNRNDWSVTIAKRRSKAKVLDGLVAIETNFIRKEITKHLHNIRTILLHSNATPIKSYNGIGYTCCFCSEQYPIPKDLKKHTLDNHDKTAKGKFMQGCPLSIYVVKLDITGLNCAICGIDFEDLQKFVDHLQNDHDKTLYTDINNHILPFKFDGEGFTCVICAKNFERFKLIQEHMNVHYNNYTCEVCNAPFVNKRTLKSHMSRHKQGEFNCSFCPKVFDTHNKKANHEKFVHTGDQRRNICPYCKEKFLSYAKKNEHMVEIHGVEPLVLQCKACDKTFTRRDKLTRHTKRDHLLERRFECDHCDMKFYGRKDLNTHMVKHTGVKQYRCEVCLKAFGRRHTLREHLRIHADDRRFKCEHCGQAFVQKCSWKSHMRSKHAEFV